MASPLALIAREAYRREVFPPRALWWLAASGMRDWFRVLASKLRDHLPDSRALLSELGREMFIRRYAVLRREHPSLPAHEQDPRALPLLMAGLYRLWTSPKAGFIFDVLGGPPRGVVEHLRARALARQLSPKARWEEVTVHLGELLILLTERLPAHLPHARKILSDICFDMGQKYASRVQSTFGLPPGASAPESAIFVLRTSEYVFRVNPKHWSASDGQTNTGYLEGDACPWFTRPGWNAAHCGIFGQFQAGISSAFGLRYQLSRTIPKHGGDTCRIDLKPLSLRRSKDGPALQ